MERDIVAMDSQGFDCYVWILQDSFMYLVGYLIRSQKLLYGASVNGQLVSIRSS